jgi:hypothetical protein
MCDIGNKGIAHSTTTAKKNNLQFEEAILDGIE